LLLQLSAPAKQRSRKCFYIEQYKQLAIDEMIRTSVPASITLAYAYWNQMQASAKIGEESIIILALSAKADWAGDLCLIMMMMLK